MIYSDITFADVRAWTPSQLFDEVIKQRFPTSGIGQIHGVTFQNVDIGGYHPPYTTKPVLNGFDATHQLSDVSFVNFSVNCRLWRTRADALADGVTFGPYVSNIRFVPGPGPKGNAT